MKTRKLFVFLALLVLTSVLLAACAPATEAPVEETEEVVVEETEEVAETEEAEASGGRN